jgi:hypothetical protein
MLGVVLAAMSGCGGSSSSTSSTVTDTASSGSSAQVGTSSDASTATGSKLIATVEAICARRNSAINAVDFEVETEAQLKRVAHGRATVEQRTLNELSRLGATSSLEPGWRRFITYRRLLVKDWTAVTELHGAKNAKAFVLADRAQKHMLAAAKQEHLKQCTEVD